MKLVHVGFEYVGRARFCDVYVTFVIHKPSWHLSISEVRIFTKWVKTINK